MATAEQYADWIVANKDKKGTPEFQTVVEAYQIAKEDEAKVAAPTAAEVQARGTNWIEALPIAAGGTLVNLGRLLTGQEVPQVEQEAMAALRKEQPVATMVGEAAPFFVPSMGLAPTGLAARVSTQAAIGAAEGATYAKGRGEEPLPAGTFGAGVAGAMEAASPLIGRALSQIWARVRGRAPTAPLVDAAGQPTQEALDALTDAGVTLQQVKEAASAGYKPTPQPREALEGVSTTLGAAAAGEKGAAERLAVEAAPSAEVAAAGEALNIPLRPSTLSTNPTFRAITAGLDSMPASQGKLLAREQVETLAQRAAETIEEFGGTADKSTLSEVFRQKSQKLITDLELQADKAYKAVNKAIPPVSRVEPKNTISMLEQWARELGGAEYLPKEMKPLLVKEGMHGAKPGALAYDFPAEEMFKRPTYARLDNLRREVGAAIGKNEGPFRNAEKAGLQKLYSAMLEDQKIAAQKLGAGKLYDVASGLVATRKTIEDQLVAAIGKDLSRDITTKAGAAVLALQRGETRPFTKLLESIPKELGPRMRKEIVVSALGDAFAGRAGGEGLSVRGFAKYMTLLNRNQTARAFLAKEIGPNAMKRLDTLATVTLAIDRANKDAISNGLIRALPGLDDEAKSIAARLYGVGKSTLEATTGPIGRGVVRLTDVATASNVTRAQAADALLSSQRFQNILIKAAGAKLDTPAKKSTAEKIMAKLPEFKRWAATVPADELRRAASIGFIAYFNGEEEPSK